MKTLFTVLGILLLVVIGAAVLLPKLIPMETVAAEVKAQVKEASGRDLDFQDASVVFWPNIGVELKQVTLSNPGWAQEKNMLSLSEVNVALAVMPLLQRRIEIKRFILVSPSIYLETGAEGQNSWDFSSASEQAASGKEKSGGLPEGFALQFSQIDIKNGKLTLVDHRKNKSTIIENIDVKVSFPTLESPLELKGQMTYQKKPVEIVMGVEKALDFLEGKGSTGRASLKTDDATVKAEGVFSSGPTLLKGSIDVSVSSFSQFLAWVGNGQAKEQTFNKVSLSSSSAQITKTDLILKDAALKLDDVQAQGNISVGFAAKPDIFARLSLGKLDLDKLMDAAASGGSAENKKSDDWDTKSLGLSVLKDFNADVELTTQGFVIKNLEVGPSTLAVQVQNGSLHMKSSEASLYDGKFSFDMTVNGAAPSIAVKANLAGVQAKPLLSAFADFKKLNGVTDATVSVTATGDSQKSIVSTMDGNGSVVFKNGSLEGIDLVNIAKMVQKRLTNIGIGEGKTDFVELGGTFTLKNGVASNSDLKMKGPLVQATGKGTIDLPKKYIQYRVVPVLTASSAVEGASGLAVPVDITGSFNSLKVKPDFASAIQDVINNPDAAKATLKGVKEQGKALEKDLKTLKKDPLNALKNILGGGGLFGKSEPEEAPVVAPEAAPAQTPPPEAAPVQPTP